MTRPDAGLRKELISLHCRKIFAFALFLSGGDKDRAYEATASAFAETLVGEDFPSDPEESLAALARAVYGKAGQDGETALPPRFDEEDYPEAGAGERTVLRFVSLSLAALHADERALILLRDQMNLGYRAIGRAIGVSEADARERTISARLALRKKVEETLRRGR